MKFPSLAASGLTALVLATVACPASAIAATTTPESGPTTTSNAAAPRIGSNWVATSFVVNNITNHDEYTTYDSDGSGSGYYAQFLNADGTDVAKNTHVDIPAGQSRTFYIEFDTYSTEEQPGLRDDASADMYFSATPSAAPNTTDKVHMKANSNDSANDETDFSWVTWDLQFNGQESNTPSASHVGDKEISQDRGGWSHALAPATDLVLN